MWLTSVDQTLGRGLPLGFASLGPLALSAKIDNLSHASHSRLAGTAVTRHPPATLPNPPPSLVCNIEAYHNLLRERLWQNFNADS